MFLFQILPSKPVVDEWLWVVVGDLPPAYFVAEGIKSPRDALDAYIWHRSKWTEAILAGREPGNGVMPVDADPTVELAQALSTRLKLLSDNVLPTFKT